MEAQQRVDGVAVEWVRRVAIGSYPRVACGSACGSVFSSMPSPLPLVCAEGEVVGELEGRKNDTLLAAGERLPVTRHAHRSASVVGLMTASAVVHENCDHELLELRCELR